MFYLDWNNVKMSFLTTALQERYERKFIVIKLYDTMTSGIFLLVSEKKTHNLPQGLSGCDFKNKEMMTSQTRASVECFCLERKGIESI